MEILTFIAYIFKSVQLFASENLFTSLPNILKTSSVQTCQFSVDTCLIQPDFSSRKKASQSTALVLCYIRYEPSSYSRAVGNLEPFW